MPIKYEQFRTIKKKENMTLYENLMPYKRQKGP